MMGDIAIDLENMGELPPLDSHNSQQQQLGFIDFESHQTAGYASGPMTTEDSVLRERTTSSSGGSYLTSKGFGWLMEKDEDEDDEEFMHKPLLEELDIDVKDIYYKVRCVLLPLPYFRLKLALVRDSPDFWGPLIVVLTYALISLYGQLSVVSWILSIWFVGSFIIFFLARALGGEIGYSACLGVIGYCLIPVVITALLLSMVGNIYIIRWICKICGISWAVYSAGTLLCVDELQDKKPLLLYPVFLLYVYFLSLYTGV